MRAYSSSCPPSSSGSRSGSSSGVKTKPSRYIGVRIRSEAMELGLKGKVALVTASSKGIGLGTAKVLAGEGMKVAISSRDAATLKKASDQIAAATGEDVLAVTADMTVRE